MVLLGVGGRHEVERACLGPRIQRWHIEMPSVCTLCSHLHPNAWPICSIHLAWCTYHQCTHHRPTCGAVAPPPVPNTASPMELAAAGACALLVGRLSRATTAASTSTAAGALAERHMEVVARRGLVEHDRLSWMAAVRLQLVVPQGLVVARATAMQDRLPVQRVHLELSLGERRTIRLLHAIAHRCSQTGVQAQSAVRGVHMLEIGDPRHQTANLLSAPCHICIFNSTTSIPAAAKLQAQVVTAMAMNRTQRC